MIHRRFDWMRSATRSASPPRPGAVARRPYAASPYHALKRPTASRPSLPTPSELLSYAPSTAGQWLDALSTLTEVTQYKQLSYKMLDLHAGQRVLDLGCGTGEDAQALLPLVAPDGQVIGVDTEMERIKEARAKQAQAGLTGPGLQFFHADGDRLPFGSGTFDRIRIDRVLQHVEAPHRVLREVWRVLRPGGRVIAVEPDWRNIALYPGGIGEDDADDMFGHVVRWQLEDVRHPLIGRQLRAVFTNAEFAQVEVYPIAYATHQFQVADLALEISPIMARLSTGISPTLPGERVREWLSAMRRADDAGHFFASMCLFFASALKLA